MDYFPDKWLVVKISSEEDTHYRIFACWYGGFANGDSWKLNSGIKEIEVVNEAFRFIGDSGSRYIGSVNNYGISGYGSGVLSSLIAGQASIGVEVTKLDEQEAIKYILETINEKAVNKAKSN